MLEAEQQTCEKCSVVREQQLRSFIEKCFGIWIEKEGIKEYVARQRRSIFDLPSVRECGIPCIHAGPLLAEQELAEHS
jgi:hypothetical protein